MSALPLETASADRGPWLQTYTGKAFYPFDPRPEDIDIWDVATALSHECRWGGHTKRFYPVAWHSVLVARELCRYGNRVALMGLLHDGSEAYLRDIPRPLKMHPSFAPYRALEKTVQHAIFEKWGGQPTPEEATLIHAADEEQLAYEAYNVLDGGPQGWAPPGPNRSRGYAIWFPTPEDARDRFLSMFLELTTDLGIAR